MKECKQNIYVMDYQISATIQFPYRVIDTEMQIFRSSSFNNIGHRTLQGQE